jgi:signal transduction histidine kinase
MDEQFPLPATLAPDSRQKRWALIVALLVPVPFLAMIPFGQMQLPRVDSYIPVVDTVMFINDSIAATLLFAQFSIIRWPSLLALAGGFLLTAFLVIPHALTFPGAFAPEGLLGAQLQTTPWLNEFWFMGLPFAVIAYVLLKDAEPVPRHHTRFAMLTTVTVAFAVTWGLLRLTTVGADLLPAIMQDGVRPQLSWHFLPLVALNLTAIALLWRRRESALDLWLLVVLEAWMLNAFLFNKLVVRFSLFWYGGRVFAALATSLILVFLLSETTVLYWRLARSHTLLERERDNKLMNLEAMVAAISHELKQPLAAIGLNGAAALNFLQHAPSKLADARSALIDVVDDNRRANQILDNIRDLFGRGGREKEQINVNDSVLAVLRLLRGELTDHHVATEVQLATGLPRVRGHRVQLQEVIANLVRNAIEAMSTTDADSRTLKVRTKPDGGNTIVLEVEDSGPGIDEARLERIFEAFVTTKSDGMGLGLAICRTIVERHGGRLASVPNRGKGGLFLVVLPVEPASDPMGSSKTDRPTPRGNGARSIFGP